MDIETIIANSYKDFHAKGLDYICTSRSEAETTKYYFFDGDVSKLSEVVNPHDHRYNFNTTVLAGAMADHRFSHSENGDVYQSFDYMTPLNNGNGFSFRSEERLLKIGTTKLDIGKCLFSPHDTLHTIQILKNQTVLRLSQYSDVVPVDAPTSCWVRSGEPKPDTSGLYSKFTPDEIIGRLEIIDRLTNQHKEVA